MCILVNPHLFPLLQASFHLTLRLFKPILARKSILPAKNLHFSDKVLTLVLQCIKIPLNRTSPEPLNQFPESQILEHIDNTWKDTAKAVFNNWLGKIYQLTNQNRRLPFMEGVDPNNPFDL